MSVKDYGSNARIMKAFADENRLMILELLQTGEKCACRLLEDLKIGQSTLSHHMKILCDAGVVTPRKEGKWIHYSIAEAGCDSALGILQEITTVHSTEEDCSCR